MERGRQDRREGSRNRNEFTRWGSVDLGVIGTVLANLYPGIGMGTYLGLGLGAAIGAFVGFSVGARDGGRDER